MSKITCDICGTTYADTAPCCPICGNTRDYDDGITMEQLLAEEQEGYALSGRRREIFDFDEVNSPSYQDDQESYETYDEEDYPEEEENSGPSTWVIILLTVLITSMLAVAGFIFIRFYLPGSDEKKPESSMAVVETQEAQTETTVYQIPCEELVMSSGASAQLSAQGQNFLLHVQAMPADTTDRIIYTSGDEAVATVTEDGRITAVAEGETIIYIACGTRTLECPVVVKYVEDTTPPAIDIQAPLVAEDTDSEETQESTELPAETAAQAESQSPAETTSSAAKSDVVLKLKKTDVQLGVYLQFTLELDCDLKPEDVEWSSEHTYIATVDEKGVVKSVKSGTTVITAKYGDQTAQCIVRCK